MKFGEIIVVTAWHSHDSEVEHRRIQGKETNGEKCPAYFGPHFIVHAAKHFRKPVMNGSKECKTNTTENNEMEVSDYKSRVVYINVSC